MLYLTRRKYTDLHDFSQHVSSFSSRTRTSFHKLNNETLILLLSHNQTLDSLAINTDPNFPTLFAGTFTEDMLVQVFKERLLNLNQPLTVIVLRYPGGGPLTMVQVGGYGMCFRFQWQRRLCQ